MIPIVTPYLGPLESSPTLSEIAPEPRLKACIAAWFFVNRRNGVDMPMEEIRRHVMQLVSDKRSAARMLRERIASMMKDDDTITGDVDEHVEHGTGGGGQGGNVNDGVQNEGVKKRRVSTDQTAITTTTTTTIGGRGGSTMASDVTVTRTDNGYIKIELSVHVPGTVVVEFDAKQ